MLKKEKREEFCFRERERERERMSQELTPEQKARIERNKREALERRRKSALSLSLADVDNSRIRRVHVHSDRIRRLNGDDVECNEGGRYVLYWMQSSQRSRYNEALEVAMERANARKKPLVVAFALTCDYKDANERHYNFMVKGLLDVKEGLSRRKVPFFLVTKKKREEEKEREVQTEIEAGIPEAILSLSKNAIEIITDCGYLRVLRIWRETLARKVSIPITEVETDVVVPVFAHLSSRPKLDVSAASFRSFALPKSFEHTENVPDLEEIPALWNKEDAENARVSAFETLNDRFAFVIDGKIASSSSSTASEQTAEDILSVLKAKFGLKETPNIPKCDKYHVGGEIEAMHKLEAFLDPVILRKYGELRNDCSLGLQSHLAPYIHYGQISVLHVAKRARRFAALHKSDEKIQRSVEVFLDELIIRRELGIQFVVKKRDTYDTFDALPIWCINTLEKHRDERETRYTYEELEKGQTDDPLWNAAQNELRLSGKTHNYTRMYWGKKVVEWFRDSREAWTVLMRLNDTYSLDGRDPNSFTGVGWVFGLNDRSFPEAPVMGEVRRMSMSGCKKKFGKAIDAYIERWNGQREKGGRQVSIANMFKKQKRY